MCLIWVQDDFEKGSRTGSVPNNVEREVEKEPGVGELRKVDERNRRRPAIIGYSPGSRGRPGRPSRKPR